MLIFWGLISGVLTSFRVLLHTVICLLLASVQMVQDIDEVFENERYYGVTWRPPALLERPKWSDANGNVVALDKPLTTESDDWKLDINHSTDFEGWQYGSVFKHLEYARPGGRAERRVGDLVRRRKWMMPESRDRSSGQNSTAQNVARATSKVAHSLISPVTQMQGSKVRKQTEMERRKSSLRMFFGMLTNTFKRQQLWSLLPMDPSAWYFLLTSHQSELIAGQAATLASAPLIMGPSRPAQGQGDDKGPSTDAASLVRQLVCAAVHSKAAYGHAMAAGHLSSLYNFALLQTLHQLNFNPVGGASGEANNEAVAALAGIPAEDIRLAEWHNSVMRPCHYLAVDRANHCIVLSIRGSLETGDILMDLTAKPMEVFGLLGREGLVHEGMMAAATYIQCNTGPALQAVAEEFPGWPLFLTGHSMGGSVAAILALLMRENTESTPKQLGPVRCIAIGPAPVFSRPLAEACNPFVTSIVHGADVVPRISYASVEGCFIEFANSSTIGTLKRRVTQTLEGLKVDWYHHLKPSFHPPQGLSGLANFVGLAEDEGANAKAARAAQAAAKVAEHPGSHWSGSVELTESSQDNSKTGIERRANGTYDISETLTEQAAEAAAKKLAQLRGESQKWSDARARAEGGHHLQRSAQFQDHNREESQQQDSDQAKHEIAADILQTGGNEFRDQSGNPEPLYVAGRILWMVPPKEWAAAAKLSAETALPAGMPRVESLAEVAGLHGAGQSESRRGEQGAPGGGKGTGEVATAGHESKLMDSKTSESCSHPAEPHLHRLPARKRSEPEDGRALIGGPSFPSLAIFEDTKDVDSVHGSEGASKRPKSDASTSTNEASHTSMDQENQGMHGRDRLPGKPTGKAVPSVYEVERDVFTKILLTVEMMQDHLPGSYLDAINQL